MSCPPRLSPQVHHIQWPEKGVLSMDRKEHSDVLLHDVCQEKRAEMFYLVIFVVGP